MESAVPNERVFAIRRVTSDENAGLPERLKYLIGFADGALSLNATLDPKRKWNGKEC